MFESLGPAVIKGVIELLQKHQINYIARQLTGSCRYLHILVGKKCGKRLITIAIVYKKEEYYVELLLHNTARAVDKYTSFQFQDEPIDVAKLEKIVKPIFICVSHPDLFAIIDDYILNLLNKRLICCGYILVLVISLLS